MGAAPQEPPAVTMLRHASKPKPARDDAGAAAPPLRNGERLRLGLTGLGAIFLIVMVVAAGLKPISRQQAAEPQGESLAVLGVAPGAGSTPSVPPAGAAAPATTPAPPPVPAR
jgi:hypothetical protein